MNELLKSMGYVNRPSVAYCRVCFNAINLPPDAGTLRCHYTLERVDPAGSCKDFKFRMDESTPRYRDVWVCECGEPHPQGSEGYRKSTCVACGAKDERRAKDAYYADADRLYEEDRDQ